MKSTTWWVLLTSYKVLPFWHYFLKMGPCKSLALANRKGKKPKLKEKKPILWSDLKIKLHPNPDAQTPSSSPLLFLTHSKRCSAWMGPSGNQELGEGEGSIYLALCGSWVTQLKFSKSQIGKGCLWDFIFLDKQKHPVQNWKPLWKTRQQESQKTQPALAYGAFSFLFFTAEFAKAKGAPQFQDGM